MTTFLESEIVAQEFALIMINGIKKETFKQKPEEDIITQFGFEHEGGRI